MQNFYIYTHFIQKSLSPAAIERAVYTQKKCRSLITNEVAFKIPGNSDFMKEQILNFNF